MIGEDAREPHGPLPIDRSALRFTLQHRAGTPTQIAHVVSHLGDAIVLALLGGLLGVWLLRQRRGWFAAALPLVTLAVASAVETAIKHAVGRPRPAAAYHLVAEHNAAFPSGHTTAATAFFIASALVIAPLVARRWRGAILLGSGSIATAVGVARLVLGVHWLTDVAAGWAFGAACALGVSLATARYEAGVAR